MQRSLKPTFALIPLRRYSWLLRAPKFFRKDWRGRRMDLPATISTTQRIDRWTGGPLCLF